MFYFVVLFADASSGSVRPFLLFTVPVSLYFITIFAYTFTGDGLSMISESTDDPI